MLCFQFETTNIIYNENVKTQEQPHIWQGRQFSIIYSHKTVEYQVGPRIWQNHQSGCWLDNFLNTTCIIK